MRLHPDVYFQRYGTYTFLRHVGERKDFLYNDTAFAILKYVEEHPGCSCEELCRRLSLEFEAAQEELEQDVRAFAEELYASGILLKTEEVSHRRFSSVGKEESPLSGEKSIRDLIQEQCCANNWLQNACLELTYRCNERCIHCYIDDPPCAGEELGFEAYKKILEELKEMGCMSVLLTGGEPLLHPDFLKIARYAKELRLMTDIYTNGLALRQELLKQLLLLKPNSISFSFYGGRAEIHDQITGVPGSFERSLEAMKACRKAGIDTYIKTVVMRQNAEDYEELLKLGKKMDVKVLSSLSIIPTHKGRSVASLRLPDAEAYRRILRLEYKYGNLVWQKEAVNRPDLICASGRSTLSVDPFGNVHPCNGSSLVLGNCRETPLAFIWEHSPLLREIRSLRYKDVSEACGSCPDRNWCSICMGGAMRENGKLAPGGDTCLIARAAREEFLSLGKLEGAASS